MPHMGGCIESVSLLNAIFQVPAILNDGHEILARLNAGDDLMSIVIGMNGKFGRPENELLIGSVFGAWPSLHREAIGNVVRWALGKLDTKDRILIDWKGNAEHPETLTSFQLSGNRLSIEAAHPPGRFS